MDQSSYRLTDSWEWAGCYADSLMKSLATGGIRQLLDPIAHSASRPFSQAIDFRSRTALWVGFLSVVAGVALQLPMSVDAAATGYRLT